MTDRPLLSRRTAVGGLLAGLLAPGALAACSTGSAPAPAASSAPGTVLAELSAVPVGGGAVVEGPGGKVLLVQESAGTVTGYEARCPHAGVTVNPPVDGVVVCPAHGSRFDPATGDVVRGPAQTGLAPLAVAVSGTQVVLA